MFVDLSAVKFDSYDVFVAGSGFAGYSVAKRLSERGRRVLVFETGVAGYNDDIQTAHSQMYGRGHYSGSHWPFHWIRALGGTSAVWGGWCGPLLERNFAQWPIGASDLADYYISAAKELGRAAPTITYEDELIEGFRYRPFSTEIPVRLGDDTAMFDALEGVDVLLNSTVAGLIATSERGAVKEFSLFHAQSGPRDVALSDRQVLVLAAGGIGNAQVLLGSRMSSGPEVGNETDQVGRYLMEHPHFLGCGRIVTRSQFELPTPPRDFGEYSNTIIPDAQSYEAIGGMDVAITLNGSRPDPSDPVEAYLMQQMGAGAQVFELNIMTEMRADPENRLIALETNDPSGLPILRAQCVIDTSTFRAADTSLTRFSEALTQSELGRLRIFNENLYFDVTGGGHIMGTTRMGEDPRISVVDQDCRVHGYRNLFIAGSSVFTTGGYANPTLTLVALAQRLGDTLANEVLI